MKPKLGTAATGLVEARIADVGRDLARSLAKVLHSIPGSPHRPQRLARSLGLNTVLTSRLLKATQQKDPLAAAHSMPGPEPLRRLLLAAERKHIAPELIKDARAAVDRFQHLIDVEAGDRSTLDAIISGWLPEAREQVELLAKQAVFRGVSQLLGMTCEVQHSAFVIHPSAQNPDRADVVSLMATLGLRRVRPGFMVNYDSVHAKAKLLTLAGEPVERIEGLLLEEFCSRPLPELEISHIGDVVQYTLSGESVGMQSAVDLVHATLLPAHKELHRAPDDLPRQATVAFGTGTPVRTMIVDVLLHDDVYAGQSPELRLYQTVGIFYRPPAVRGGMARDPTRLEVMESVQSLGHGLSQFRTADTPDYLDMLNLICDRRGWDGRALRGFRCRIEYPMYSSEVVLSFELPEH